MLSRDMIEKLPTPQLMQMMQDPRYENAFPSIVAALTQRKEIQSKLAAGGPVKRYAVGDAVQGGYAQYSQPNTLGKMQDYQSAIQRLVAQGYSPQEAAQTLNANAPAPSNMWPEIKAGLMALPGKIAGAFTPSGNAQAMAEREQAYQDLLASIPAMQQQGQQTAQQPQTAPAPQAAPPSGLQAAQVADQLKQQAMAQSMMRNPVTAPARPTTAIPANPFGYPKAPELPTPEVKTQAQYMAERNAMVPDRSPERMDAISRLEAENAVQEKQAPWEALLQTGLSIMSGTSPYALTNIGQGGAAGLKAYQEQIKELKKSKEGLTLKRMGIEDASDAQKLAGLEWAMKNANADKERVIQTMVTKYGFEKDQAKFAADVAKERSEAQLRAAQAGYYGAAANAANAKAENVGAKSGFTPEEQLAKMEKYMAFVQKTNPTLPLPAVQQKARAMLDQDMASVGLNGRQGMTGLAGLAGGRVVNQLPAGAQVIP